MATGKYYSLQMIGKDKTVPVIIGRTHPNQEEIFPPGFRYIIGSVVCTVTEDSTVEKNSPMRTIITSEGDTEVLSIESLGKDLKETNAKIIEPDEKYILKNKAKGIIKK